MKDMESEQGPKDKEINVAFMGIAEVGKSAIVERILGKDFSNFYKPTVFEYYTHRLMVDGQHVSLNISDTSGAYNFPAMDRLTIRKSDVVVLVFSLASGKSFHRVEKLATDIESIAPKKPIIFVGNKSELKKTSARSEDLEDYVMFSLNYTYIEMSAKCDKNIDRLLKQIYEEHKTAIRLYIVRQTPRNSVTDMKNKLSQSCKNLLSSYD